MKKTQILAELGDRCPGIIFGQIQCAVANTKFNKELWEEINCLQSDIRAKHSFETIRNQPNIKATREVYKACGKDPNRYRPSAESLYRRIVKGNDLYRINTLVDLVNLFSLQSGYSIGGFDADFIDGNLTAGVGEKDEPYEGIGRGKLNIEGLPVLRDKKGGIGTPTSDEVRTAIRLETTHFFMNVNAYTGESNLDAFLEDAVCYLEKYVSADEVYIQKVKYNHQG